MTAVAHQDVSNGLNLMPDAGLPEEVVQDPFAVKIQGVPLRLVWCDEPSDSRIHCFNAGSTMSHAALAGDIPGLAYGANRLSHAIASSLFVAGADALQLGLRAHDDRELEPTRYFLPR